MKRSLFSGLALVASLALVAPVQAQDADIVETAQAAGTFTTLLAAAEAAGLVDVLQSDGPFTVFAPTDEAFEKLPEGTVEALLNDPESLQAILLYHVVPSRVMAESVVGMSQATSAQGGYIQISVDGNTVMLNGEATVIQTDIEASNGVIHVIDTVLIPGN